MVGRAALLILASIVSSGLARAEKPKLLVLPLPPSSAVDRDLARLFDARFLVELEATGRVVTVTPTDEPECTTVPCLATLATSAGAVQVVSLSAAREQRGVTLFGTVIDARTATTIRRGELALADPRTLATTAPAELARQLAGAPAGPTVLGVAVANAGIARTAGDSIASRLAALRTFSVVTVGAGADRAVLTHRADIAISELAITKRRHHVHHYFDGVLVATLSIVDLADRHVLFTKTVKITASERKRYSTTAEVAAILVEGAVTEWMTAFTASAIEPRLRGGTSR
ncbi:MAG: hypothetical protein ABI867_20510 [Kofleriaceae bacterium]